VPLLEDATVEGNETFSVRLSSPSGGATLGGVTTGVVTIRDNDATPNHRFVAQVYLDVLRRAVDSSGLANWVGLLERGGTRDVVVRNITASAEYRSLIVQDSYQRLLGRSAESGGLQAWVGFLGQGGTVEHLDALILGSGEFYARAGSGPAAFVQALYQTVLRRLPDPTGAQAWNGALAGGLSRADVALAILTSPEARPLQVDALYQRYLVRPADPTGSSVFSDALRRGWRQEEVLAALVASGEYFNRV
jgi:hypothetical protein